MLNGVLRRTGHEVAPWIERLARLGYTSKGVVFIIIGALSAATPLGMRGKAADRRDAFRFILEQPFGKFLLLVIALGLLGYAVWRISSAINDSERRGADAKGLAMRAGGFIRGAMYGVIAYEVVRLAMRKSIGGSGSDAQTRHWTARLMEKPFGHWLVGIAGLCVLGYGIYQLFAAMKSKLSKQLHLDSAPQRGLLIAISRFGIAARGVVFGVIGWSLVRAAWSGSPGKARGTAGALRELAAQPYGGVLLVVTGVGLAAYGVYALVNAKYRRIEA